MKTITLAIVAIALLLVTAFGVVPWLNDYTKQTRTNLNQGVASQIENDNLFAGAQEDIARFEQKVQSQLVKVIDVKSELADTQYNLSVEKNSLSTKETAVSEADDWLDSHQPTDTFTKDNRTHSYSEVASAARITLEMCNTQKARIMALEESCTMLGSAVNQAETAINESLAKINKTKDEVESKRIQLAAWEAVKATRAIASSLNTSALDYDIVSLRHMKEIDKRLNEMAAIKQMADSSPAVNSAEAIFGPPSSTAETATMTQDTSKSLAIPTRPGTPTVQGAIDPRGFMPGYPNNKIESNPRHLTPGDINNGEESDPHEGWPNNEKCDENPRKARRNQQGSVIFDRSGLLEGSFSQLESKIDYVTINLDRVEETTESLVTSDKVNEAQIEALNSRANQPSRPLSKPSAKTKAAIKADLAKYFSDMPEE